MTPDTLEHLLLVCAVIRRLAETIALPLMEIAILWLLLWATAWLGLEWARAPRLLPSSSSCSSSEAAVADRRQRPSGESSSKATHHTHH